MRPGRASRALPNFRFRRHSRSADCSTSGGSVTCSMGPTERCVLGSNSRRDSTESPKNSRRTGRSASAGKDIDDSAADRELAGHFHHVVGFVADAAKMRDQFVEGNGFVAGERARLLGVVSRVGKAHAGGGYRGDHDARLAGGIAPQGHRASFENFRVRRGVLPGENVHRWQGRPLRWLPARRGPRRKIAWTRRTFPPARRIRPGPPWGGAALSRRWPRSGLSLCPSARRAARAHYPGEARQSPTPARDAGSPTPVFPKPRAESWLVVGVARRG